LLAEHGHMVNRWSLYHPNLNSREKECGTVKNRGAAKKCYI
jgi:hypothetical protein